MTAVGGWVALVVAWVAGAFLCWWIAKRVTEQIADDR